MWREILAFIVGLVLAFVCIVAIQGISYFLIALPFDLEGLDQAGREEVIQTNMHLIPLSSFLMLLLSHFVGALVGGFLATRMSRASLVPGYLVVALVLCSVVYNLTTIPHPIWISIVDPLGVIVFGLFGVALGRATRGLSAVNPHKPLKS